MFFYSFHFALVQNPSTALSTGLWQKVSAFFKALT